MEGGTTGKVNVGLYKEQEFNQNVLVPHVFGGIVKRFVFRPRGNPSCLSVCVKIQFHVQHEERETTILTVTSRVFDGFPPKFILLLLLLLLRGKTRVTEKSIYTIQNTCEDIVLG